MTDERRFAKSADFRENELWNVSLLPIVRERAPGLLENLDERRSANAKVSPSESFEAQLEAVGW